MDKSIKKTSGAIYSPWFKPWAMKMDKSQIDLMVYELYGLTEEEIEIIENG